MPSTTNGASDVGRHDEPAPDEKPTLDGFTGEVAARAMTIFGAEAGTLAGARVGFVRWFDNVGIQAGLHFAHDVDSSFAAGGYLGGRVLASTTKTGPFAGAGLGLIGTDTPLPEKAKETTGDGGLGAFVELGIVARGRFFVGARLDLPFYSIEGRPGVARSPADAAPPRDRVHPLPLSAELGFVF